ncbi:MAG TPA: ABC transporter substrate-binding protein [Thermomicrobiales bacterium]|nr:ABC transporter substrate-binding protein [Thermomicrobiales bacterium]
MKSIDELMLEWEHGRLTRRSMLRRAAALGISIPAMAALVGGKGSGRASAAILSSFQDDPASGIKGGVLKIATIGEAPHLDEHQTTAGVVAEVSYPIYETLFTYDATYQTIPELVDTHTVSDDGLVHTMALRKGVLFHNGEEMKAADVIASVQRWGGISGVGKRVMEKTASIEATDDYTVTWTLSSPYGTILIALAHNTQACTIHPASIVNAGTAEPWTDVAQYIGTGPYKLKEWIRDSVLRLERFEEYVSSSETPNGYGGKKFAYADMIEFYPVPEEAARVAGIQAGDYLTDDRNIGNDQYEVLNGQPGVIAEILPPTQWDLHFMNWESAMFKDNLAMREAILYAMDPLPQLQSGRGGGDFVRLDPGLMMQQTAWYTKAGADGRYNVYNPDTAKAKLQEAGYAGETLRFLTTQEYSYMYGQVIVMKQQLEDVGIVVDMQVTDWATVLENRAKKDAWEMFLTGHGFVPDPSQISYVGQMNIYPGWWSSESSLALAASLLSETEFDTRFGIWEQVQTAAYTELPALKTGDSSICSFRSEKLGGWDPQFERGAKYWNFWIKE